MAEEKQVTVETSKFLTLDKKDFLKGLLITVLGAVLTPLSSILESGSMSFDWKHILGGGLAAGVAYLLKNWLSPSQTVIKVTPPIKGLNDEGEGEGGGFSDPDKPKPKP